MRCTAEIRTVGDPYVKSPPPKYTDCKLIPSIWPSLAWVIAEKQRRHAVPLNFLKMRRRCHGRQFWKTVFRNEKQFAASECLTFEGMRANAAGRRLSYRVFR
jgi:hypothetical protein